MADLLVIEYPTEERAEEVRQRLLSLQTEYLIQLGDAVVAIKKPDGTVKLKQLINPVKSGALGGVLWGSLIGLLFMMPLAGAAVGAAGGALGGKLTDFGINDQFMKEAAQSLHSGNAALFLLIRKMTTDKVMAELRGSGGKIMRSSFDDAKEAELRAALQEAQLAIQDATPAQG
ncbi:MAG: DUF1269 domain-containing protein [Geminicoccaceae bacterium]|jgi:uncharacterized membrane protein|nr:DUF1269 domain-containing protein [Geminicoccaceae bacterium]HRY25979.1 DUF1269 domain-containing protein [Geminicoccaceae bacterium]